MRQFYTTLFACFFTASASSQYYVRGEVRDEQGHVLPAVKITLSSKRNFPYYSGSAGAFGIPTSLKIDTITLSIEGYETLTTAINTSQYNIFSLKMSSYKSNSAPRQLLSLTKNHLPDKTFSASDAGESYSSTIENQFINTSNYSETGFSLHVDRASYSNIRRFLNIKSRPPADAVRIEEMLNYFNIRSKHIDDQKETFTVNTHLTSCPWNKASQLLFINLQAKKINLDRTPPTNLVFLIDVSGSMDIKNRLPLLKGAFKLLVENLRVIDTVSIVTYGTNVRVTLPPTSGEDKQRIIEAIEGLTPAGSTPGESAIRVAYKLAKKSFIRNGNNRVILATDGDFNVGQNTEKELEELIALERKSGIYLTCLGVGMGNYKDSKLEALAKNGNGNFAYLDNEKEAEKVLIEEFAQTLYTVANNVQLTVKFDPGLIKSYRLIGFDNKEDAIADSSSQLEGGEVGSGHSLLSVFEIMPVASDTAFINTGQTVGTLKLSYKLTVEDEPVDEEFSVLNNYQSLDNADSCLRFATAIVMFGTLLKQSKFAKDVTWDDVQSLAMGCADKKNLLQMEFIQLIEKARKLYPVRNRKKGNLLSLNRTRSNPHF